LEVIVYPWLWFWAPHFHFPWSGSVAQQIESLKTQRTAAAVDALRLRHPDAFAQLAQKFRVNTPPPGAQTPF
jgi:hypothetical protein